MRPYLPFGDGAIPYYCQQFYKELLMSEFTCYLCNNTYKAQNDEELNIFKAGETSIKLFPEGKNYFTEIVCKKCHQKFIKWFYTLTEEQRQECAPIIIMIGKQKMICYRDRAFCYSPFAEQKNS
jgi:hypothetical protein